MEYLSVKETAQRLNVTERAVQKWAKEGKIPGAHKFSGAWVIPKDATTPDGIVNNDEANHKKRTAMLLLNSAYKTGSCLDFIAGIEDADDRNLCLGEYYYFSGQVDKAIAMVEEYLDSSDEALKYSASLICLFAGMAAGHGNLSSFALKTLNEQFVQGFNKEDTPTEAHAVGVFTETTAHMLLDIPIDSSVPDMKEYMSSLPGGIKMQACYVLAHQAYQDGDYVKALTIADMAIYLSPQLFPIATIYVHIVATMALMKLRRSDEAKQRMQMAWELAQKDNIIEPFVEHHGLLQGMIEVFFKKDYPHVYRQIINGVYLFADAWRNIHNLYAEFEVTDKLTTTEFIIAMLYGHGWSVKEVAVHMGLSSRTVTNYISTIYSKLYINDRKELVKYILK